ncbi:MAG: glycosyltransferase family 39 protein [Chloroflexi bacterium]|nr:glycosyltransferase family 39 protein [Chloroflexota bacterium]
MLAALLRLVDLPTRGTWDADQGHDMLVLGGMIDGRLPLLGPPTSIGEFHHGVLYYVLLAPAAFVSGGDPIAVTAWIAIGGIVAVAITGWLARAIAGPIAGLIAALLLAVSASAVEESVFIWNPNLIALSSSVALAAAWRAWRDRRPWWWIVAGSAAVVTMHCHVLGVILTPVIAALLVADVRRRRQAGDRAGAGAVLQSAVGWLAIGLLSYAPLALHELGSAGSEVRAAIGFLTSGGGSSGVSLPARIPVIGLRVLGWPLTGLITAAPLATLASAMLVGVLAVWRGWLTGRGGGLQSAALPGSGDGGGSADEPRAADERAAVRWLALGLVWTIVALAAGASGLATVIPGLPNDHYHAFADPMVVVIVGIGLAALVRSGVRRRVAGPAIAGLAILVALVGWNITRQPPRLVADGGWPAAQRAAAAVVAITGDEAIVLTSLPTFKTDEALRFPLEQAGVEVAPAGALGPFHALPETPRVILCDQLFRESIGADCGGPAEDGWIVDPASNLTPGTGTGVGPLRPISRFEAAPGRWVSVYRP